MAVGVVRADGAADGAVALSAMTHGGEERAADQAELELWVRARVQRRLGRFGGIGMIEAKRVPRFADASEPLTKRRIGNAEGGDDFLAAKTGEGEHRDATGGAR